MANGVMEEDAPDDLYRRLDDARIRLARCKRSGYHGKPLASHSRLDLDSAEERVRFKLLAFREAREQQHPHSTETGNSGRSSPHSPAGLTKSAPPESVSWLGSECKGDPALREPSETVTDVSPGERKELTGSPGHVPGLWLARTATATTSECDSGGSSPVFLARTSIVAMSEESPAASEGPPHFREPQTIKLQSTSRFEEGNSRFEPAIPGCIYTHVTAYPYTHVDMQVPARRRVPHVRARAKLTRRREHRAGRGVRKCRGLWESRRRCTGAHARGLEPPRGTKTTIATPV